MELPTPAVVLFIGVSGSGKSTLAARLAALVPGLAVLSYDQAQHALSGDWRTCTPAAVACVHDLLRARCAVGLGSVVDGTHTQPERRAVVRGIAAQYGLPTVAVVLRTPLPVCLRNQRRRPRRVPDADVRAQHARLLPQLPGLAGEGYDVLIVVDDQDQDVVLRSGRGRSTSARPSTGTP